MMDAIQLRYDCTIGAAQAIDEVMVWAEEGGRHTPGSWVHEGMDHHLEHVIDHADRAYRIESQNNLEKREELTHMLCRAAMALWSFDQGIYDDAGAEGKGI